MPLTSTSYRSSGLKSTWSPDSIVRTLGPTATDLGPGQALADLSGRRMRMPPLLRRSPSASPSFTRIRSFSILTGRRSSIGREFSAVTRGTLPVRCRHGTRRGRDRPVRGRCRCHLEGDRFTPTHPVGGAVVCHPHPLYGGSRRDVVVDRPPERSSAPAGTCSASTSAAREVRLATTVAGYRSSWMCGRRSTLSPTIDL